MEKSLRVRAGQVHGVKKGSISASVEDAIRVWLREGTMEDHGDARLYVAVLGEKRVAEAPSLQELAYRLRLAGTDPRDVVIESLPGLPATRRMGLRTRR